MCDWFEGEMGEVKGGETVLDTSKMQHRHENYEQRTMHTFFLISRN